MESLAWKITAGEWKPPPKFVDLPERCKCVKCKEALRGPIQTPCGHRICNPCFKDILIETDRAMCPGGEEECVEISAASANPDMCTKRDMDKLVVYCTYEAEGCTQTLQWKDLSVHEQECTFATASCPNEGCEETVPKDHMKRHIEEDCKYTRVPCPKCHEMIGQGFKEEHLQKECMAVSLPCPYKCGEQSLQRNQLAGHRKRCRSKPMDCKFKMIGCPFQGNDSEVMKHHANCPGDHLALVTGQAQEMSQKIVQLQIAINEASAVVDTLTSQLELHKNTMAKQKQLLDSQNKKMSTLETTLSSKQQSITDLKTEARMLKTQMEQTQANQNQSMRVLQETQNRHDRRLGDVERMRLVNTSDFRSQNNLRSELTRQDTQLAVYDIRMAEMDLRFQCLETADYTGLLIWKICDFARRKREAASGKTLSLYSQPFYTSRHGYKMCARVYLNGDGLGKGTHMSLFFVVMKGDYDPLLQWPFQNRVTLTLLDQCGGRRNLSDTFRPDPTSSSFLRPVNEMNVASGCPLFVAQSLVEERPYLVDDAIFIKVNVDANDM